MPAQYGLQPLQPKQTRSKSSKNEFLRIRLKAPRFTRNRRTHEDMEIPLPQGWIKKLSVSIFKLPTERGTTIWVPKQKNPRLTQDPLLTDAIADKDRGLSANKIITRERNKKQPIIVSMLTADKIVDNGVRVNCVWKKTIFFFFFESHY